MTIYVIINTSDVTDEMKNSTPVQLISYDESLTVFGYNEYNKPDCFEGCEELEKYQWCKKYWEDDFEIWNGPPPQLSNGGE